MLDIVLPALPGGAARVLQWLAAPGAALDTGAPLLIVRTAAVEAALPVPAAGILGEILVAAGQAADAGQTLGHIQPAGQAEARAPLRATPLARNIGAAHGIELNSLGGSGADGRVMARDVLATLPGAERPEALARADDQERAPGSIDRGPAASGHPLAPVASAGLEFDASAALDRCAAEEDASRRRGLRADLGTYVAAAVAGLLARHRALNARWTADGLLLRRRIHLAVATAGQPGLTWALVRDAADLTLRGMARALTTTEPADLSQAGFALINLSAGSLWQSAPALPAGMTAALSIGAPARRPIICDQRIVVRPVATLSLSYDARALDHAQATAFLIELRARLERRERMGE